MNTKKFFLGILLITAVYSIGALVIGRALNFDNTMYQSVAVAVLINVANAIAAFLVVEYALKKEERKFVRTFFWSTGLRFFVLVVLILFYLILGKSNRFVFVISFFILYVLLQIWEVTQINRQLKKEQ